jgi:hypothetical protein
MPKDGDPNFGPFWTPKKGLKMTPQKWRKKWTSPKASKSDPKKAQKSLKMDQNHEALVCIPPAHHVNLRSPSPIYYSAAAHDLLNNTVVAKSRGPPPSDIANVGLQN